MQNRWGRAVASTAAVLLSLWGLTGCPSNMDELFDKSRILRVSVVPNPVPAPVSGRPTDIRLDIDFDSNTENDRLEIWIRHPELRGEWTRMTTEGACAGGGACGTGSRSMSCRVWLVDTRAGTRELDCGTGSARMNPGTVRMRVDINHCDLWGLDCTTADDEFEFDLTLR